MKFPKSEEDYKNLFKNFPSAAILTILFAFLSTSFYYILFSPLLLINIISNFDDQQNLFLINILIHFLSLPIIFLIINKSQNPRDFFKYILTLYFISYTLSFYDFIIDKKAFFLTLSLIPYITLLALVSTFIWKEIHLKKKAKKAFILFLPILFIPKLLEICDQIRMPLGIYLNELSNHSFNIFFLDVGGFFFIFTNLILATAGLLIVKIARAVKK